MPKVYLFCAAWTAALSVFFGFEPAMATADAESRVGSITSTHKRDPYEIVVEHVGDQRFVYLLCLKAVASNCENLGSRSYLLSELVGKRKTMKRNSVGIAALDGALLISAFLGGGAASLAIVGNILGWTEAFIIGSVAGLAGMGVTQWNTKMLDPRHNWNKSNWMFPDQVLLQRREIRVPITTMELADHLERALESLDRDMARRSLGPSVAYLDPNDNVH